MKCRIEDIKIQFHIIAIYNINESPLLHHVSNEKELEIFQTLSFSVILQQSSGAEREYSIFTHLFLLATPSAADEYLTIPGKDYD